MAARESKDILIQRVRYGGSSRSTASLVVLDATRIQICCSIANAYMCGFAGRSRRSVCAYACVHVRKVSHSNNFIAVRVLIVACSCANASLFVS
jgi:hypothetical protein